MSEAKQNDRQSSLVIGVLAGLLALGFTGLTLNHQLFAASEEPASAPAELTPPAELPEVSAPKGLDLTWAHDPVWFDGQAEEAVYNATRSIYGKQRTYQAKAFANVEPFSAETGTKGYEMGEQSPLAFKYHVREAVPTENYVYHFSTMAYTGRDGMTPIKLDMGSQEDCGSTFKQFRVAGEKLYTNQHSYFPDQGVRNESKAAGDDLVFHDALPLVLRGFPFAEPAELTLNVVPDATTTKWSPTKPIAAKVTSLGHEKLTLPIGEIEAHGLEVAYVDGTREQYWFEIAPDRQHVMVKAKTVNCEYALISWRRWAYWAR